MEDRIIVDRKQNLLGSAKVDADQLVFGDASIIDRGKVSQLASAFKNCCDRLEPENHLPAIIGREIFLGAVRRSNVDLNQPITAVSPKVTFDTTTKPLCLHGQHRIAALIEAFPPADRWWCVDFYSPELSDETRTHLRAGFPASDEQSDGERYLLWSECRRRGDLPGEQRVSSRLSSYKRKALKQLSKNHQIHESLLKLKDYRGLWGDKAFKLGSIPKILSWKCPEEVCSYLRAVCRVWQTIAPDSTLATLIDGATVAFLQNRSPRFSLVDQEEIRASGFSRVKDADQRRELIRNCLKVPGVIHTIDTFFQDARYLEAIAFLLKPVLPNGGSLRSALLRRFRSNREEQYVETAEGRSELLHLANPGQRFAYAYLQVCLHCVRGYLRKENPVQSLRQACSVRLRELTEKLGIDASKALSDGAPAITVHPDEDFEVTLAPTQSSTDHQVALILKRLGVPSPPSFTSESRCTSLECDPKQVFLPTILQPAPSTAASSYASAYCLLNFTLLAFFQRDLEEDAARSTVPVSIQDYGSLIRRSSSLYSQYSPGPPTHQQVDGIDYLLLRSMATQAENKMAFVKLETMHIRSVDFAGDAIGAVVVEIEEGRFAGQNINPRQRFGIVKQGVLYAVEIGTLKCNLDIVGDSSFRRVVFIADKDSQVDKLFFSGRRFEDCCNMTRRQQQSS